MDRIKPWIHWPGAFYNRISRYLPSARLGWPTCPHLITRHHVSLSCQLRLNTKVLQTLQFTTNWFTQAKNLAIANSNRSHVCIIYIYIYTSLFHQRNGSSKNTYSTANKENAISKYKVNMTIISTMKKTWLLAAVYFEMVHLNSYFFSFFSRNFLVRLAKRTLGI